MPTSIEPLNLTAQLKYRGRGNPPNSHPDSSIANCFPGLEFDFRAIWRFAFEGIRVHEAYNLVLEVHDPTLASHGVAANMTILSVDGDSVRVTVEGPTVPGGPTVQLRENNNLEWTNSLARIVEQHAGELVDVEFEGSTGPFVVSLRVRSLFERATVISEQAAPVGALTQGLCSPWQADYRECGCYYWAASRPDFVNAEQQDGETVGHNWMLKDRRDNNKAPMTDPATHDRIGDPSQISYEDLYRRWEQELKFQIGGADAE